MFQFLHRSDYKNRTTNRPKPKVPDMRDAPKITGDLSHTLHYIKETAGLSDDLMIRLSDINRREVAVLFYSTITNNTEIERTIEALQSYDYPKNISSKEMPYYLARHVIPNGSVILMHNLWEIREALSRGQAVLLVDGMSAAVVMGVMSAPKRTPDAPLLESSTRGPQIAFIEDIESNVGLMRRALQSDALTMKEYQVGYRSRTKVVLMYEHDVVNPTLLDTVMKRIEAVHVDKLTGSATLEQRIVDRHWTLFPLTRATTRVDNCVKEVGQGKVLLLVDGDPTAVLIPGTISDFFQTMEDDQHGYIEATLIRWLRLASFVLSIFLPAMYIALSDFSPDLLPPVLAAQIAKSREGVPFSAATEVMLMQLVIEIVREATLRMPKVMGQTIGIVGGLVLGQASVQAGIVSSILIVNIALTAVSAFVIPSYEFTTVVRVMCWCNIIGASIFGLYGMVLVTLAFLYHAGSLKSFGANYITPLNGEHTRDLFMDGLIRMPIPLLDRRAEHLHDQESTRSSDYTDPVQHPMMEKPLRGGVKKRQRMRQK